MLTTKDIYANDNIFDDESWKEDSYKDEKKQTLHRLLDKYHNDPDEVERLSTIAEDIDFKFSRQYLDEVLRERAAGRLSLSAQPAEMRLSAAPGRRYAANAYAGTQSDARPSADSPYVYDEDRFVNTTMRPHIKEYEGITDYIYLDTSALKTIGAGANIDAAPEKLNWLYEDPQTRKRRQLDKNNAADLALMKNEIAKIDKLKSAPIKKADAYEQESQLRLSAETVEQMYQSRLRGAIDDVRNIIRRYNNTPGKRRKIPDFEKLPLNLQIVLVDMAYNLGLKRFDYIQTEERLKDNSIKMHGYPQFWDAVANRDINEMVEQSSRTGNNTRLAKRNAYIKSLLRTLQPDSY